VSKILSGDFDNPCSDIVLSQGVNEISDFQVPEPWNGDIANAPLLFLSSNPSISDVEEYPIWSSKFDVRFDFFTNRFGGGIKEWVIDGKRALAKDGSYISATGYWSEILNRAKEIIGHKVKPGIDFALTEIVHCKAQNMSGVESALDECEAKYLEHILEVAGAKVVVVIGETAGKQFRTKLNVDPEVSLIGPMRVSGKDRILLFLAAPGSNKPRKISRVLMPSELRLIQEFLHRSA